VNDLTSGTASVLREETAIVADGLRKSYGDHEAVAGLDLNIRTGEFFGLLGRNGSGKTTTLHMLSTLVRPSSGRAAVCGHDIQQSPVAVRKLIGLVFQDSALDRTLSVEENLHFAGALYSMPPTLVEARMRELLGLFDLDAKRKAPVGSLSGGMRRALDIARGVLHRPRVLFLDEPTIGLDVINRRAIWRFMEQLRKQEGITVVLTTHYLEEAADCDRVVFMRKGRVIGAGTPPALVRDLGAYILEIRSEQAAELEVRLQARLGPAVREGDLLAYRVEREDFPIADLQQELRQQVRSMALRRPDLNDVYVWLNRGEGAARS